VIEMVCAGALDLNLGRRVWRSRFANNRPKWKEYEGAVRAACPDGLPEFRGPVCGAECKARTRLSDATTSGDKYVDQLGDDLALAGRRVVEFDWRVGVVQGFQDDLRVRPVS